MPALGTHSGPGPGPGSSPGPAPAPIAGFTLLELVVVLLILGLVAGLAIPNLERLYAGTVRSTERDYILDQIASLGRRAMQERRTYVLAGYDGGQDPEAGERVARGGSGSSDGPAIRPARGPDPGAGTIDVPEGWKISFDEPLIIRANGVCLGAELTLLHRGAVDLRLRLEPPYCRIEVDV